MPTTTTPHLDFYNVKADSLYRNQVYRVCLASGSFNGDANIADIFASELPPINGYQRFSQTFSLNDGTVTGGELVMPVIPSMFTATTGALTWVTMFVIRGGLSTAAFSFATSAVDVANNRLTITNHGMGNGHRVMLAAGSGGTLPGGTNATTMYWVQAVDTNTISLHTNAALTAVVDITSVGTGNNFLKSTTGNLAATTIETPPITLVQGQSYTYQIVIREQRSIT